MRIAGNTVKKVNGHFNNTTDAGIMSMSTCKRYSQMTQKITKAVFPVAGLGTRFLPATKASPKEMLPIVDKPLIQYAVEEAAAAGITEMIFVTGRNKRAIEDHFDKAYELETELYAKTRKTCSMFSRISNPEMWNAFSSVRLKRWDWDMPYYVPKNWSGKNRSP